MVYKFSTYDRYKCRKCDRFKDKDKKSQDWTCYACGIINPASREICFSCGHSLKKKTLTKEKDPYYEKLAEIRTGPDIFCPNCSVLNFSFRTVCHTCGSQLESGTKVDFNKDPAQK